MQEKLIIYLNAHHSERPSWALVDHQGMVSRYAYHDEVTGLAQLANGREVIAIVPSEDVLLTTTKLPKMNRARLSQALPFALEEQLISDIDTLHFAAGDYQPGAEIPVAIVARDKMQQWLSLLQSWHIQVNQMISAVFAVPFTAGEWCVNVEEVAMLRTAPLQGAACDNNNLDELLRIALQAALPPPSQIIIKNYSSHPFAEGLTLSVPTTENQISPEQFMQDVARTVLSTPSINLLQTDYAPKKAKLLKMNTMQRAIYYLCMAAAVLLFLYPLGSVLILHQRASSIKNQISEIYKRQFPSATSVTAPKIRMEEKLHKLSAKIGENRLLFLLGTVGKEFVASKAIQLKRIDYQGNQLSMELTATTSEDFSSFTDALTQRGLQVRQQNATLVGSRINAILQVE